MKYVNSNKLLSILFSRCSITNGSIKIGDVFFNILSDIPVILCSKDADSSKEVHTILKDSNQLSAIDNHFKDFVAKTTFVSDCNYRIPSGNRQFLYAAILRLIKNKLTNNVHRDQSYVKREYEELGVSNFEMKCDATPIVQIYKNKPVLIPKFGRSVDAANCFNGVLEDLGYFKEYQSATILEFGCGEGQLSYRFAQLYPKLFNNLTWYGLEYSYARVFKTLSMFNNLNVKRGGGIIVFGMGMQKIQ